VAVRFLSGSAWNRIENSRLQSNAVGGYALFMTGADSNTVTQSSLAGGIYGALLDNGSDSNTIQLSTVTGGSSGIWFLAADSNTVTQSYVFGGTSGI
jgi:hypothetical protein